MSDKRPSTTSKDNEKKKHTLEPHVIPTFGGLAPIEEIKHIDARVAAWSAEVSAKTQAPKDEDGEKEAAKEAQMEAKNEAIRRAGEKMYQEREAERVARMKRWGGEEGRD